MNCMKCGREIALGQVFCKDHKMWSSDFLRGGATARGYDARWREARALFLKKHPLCAFCQAEGKIVPATVQANPVETVSDNKADYLRRKSESKGYYLRIYVIRKVKIVFYRVNCNSASRTV